MVVLEELEEIKENENQNKEKITPFSQAGSKELLELKKEYENLVKKAKELEKERAELIKRITELKKIRDELYRKVEELKRKGKIAKVPELPEVPEVKKAKPARVIEETAFQIGKLPKETIYAIGGLALAMLILSKSQKEVKK